ncbi:MAG: bifunctional phosphoglucose/phosphomannose isomerase [Candidatus Eisenbacteria bacterium]
MVLDNPLEVKELDRSGMLRLVSELPQQVEKALSVSAAVSLPGRGSRFKHVIVGGMGGSAIAGDIIRTLMEERAGVPCVVVREYEPPCFTGPESLVFCSSYSGNTEETLSLYEAAKKRRATLVCLGSGGELQKRALTDGVPFLKMETGFPPRAAIGYSFFMIYDVLRRMSILPVEPGEAEATVALLKRKCQEYGQHVPASANPAKQLALSLKGKVIVVYGTVSTQCAALRWKCQFNENSKALAFVNSFPELNHNELVGWEGLKSLRVPAFVVVLRDRTDHARVSKRVQITLEMTGSDGTESREVWSEGKTRLERIFSLIYEGDFASIYLALLYKEDPTPVKKIEQLKKRLLEE